LHLCYSAIKNIFNAEGAEEQRSVGMPDGMGKTELCFLASLLLCDEKFLTQRERRSRGAEGDTAPNHYEL
jgi:hypothetical protein